MFICFSLIATLHSLSVEKPAVPSDLKYPYSVIPGRYTPFDMSLTPEQRERMAESEQRMAEAKQKQIEEIEARYLRGKSVERKIIVEIVARERISVERVKRELVTDDLATRDKKLSTNDKELLLLQFQFAKENLNHYERSIPDHPGIEKEIDEEIRRLKK